ncbi:MAG: hypothetical protein ABSB74_14110 [Tepidisphaeraceae bacterium]
MDELIELIVRALIALFSGGSEPPQQPKIAPRVPPPLPQSPAARRPAQAQPRPRPTAMQRQQAMLQEMMRRGMAAKKPQKPVAPPPRPAAVPPRPSADSQASARPQASRPSLSAAAIRQLVTSRPFALRTMFVLSEVIQPPLALRSEETRNAKLE